jgi:hypothetical protein
VIDQSVKLRYSDQISGKMVMNSSSSMVGVRNNPAIQRSLKRLKRGLMFAPAATVDGGGDTISEFDITLVSERSDGRKGTPNGAIQG